VTRFKSAELSCTSRRANLFECSSHDVEKCEDTER
jgi:hypothetical protein